MRYHERETTLASDGSVNRIRFLGSVEFQYWVMGFEHFSKKGKDRLAAIVFMKKRECTNWSVGSDDILPITRNMHILYS